MKGFIFSRRFFIPFLIVLAGHMAWFCYRMYSLYKPDLVNKGLPSAVLWKWTWYNATGSFLLYGFLSGFVTGITFYSHYRYRKDRIGFRPFSVVNTSLLLAIAVAGFLYSSFGVPRQLFKARILLNDIVYARSYEEFSKLAKDTIRPIKSEATMTLPELYRHRLSVKKGESLEGNFLFPGIQNKTLNKVRLAIAEKYTTALLIILFGIAGIFCGLSFYKVRVIVPLLISYFAVFTGWFYCNRLFVWQYKYGNAGLVTGAFGASLLLLLILAGWYLGLRKYGAFKTAASPLSIDFDKDSAAGVGEKM
ncbi:MAG: hypothetical protein U0U70_17380 [Chitinophagaceae bacterium]